MATQAVTDDTFENDVLKADGPVLVDFWAEWCGPCKQIAPHLVSLAEEKSGELTIVKINVDENPMTSGRFGVRGLPTLMMFKGMVPLVPELQLLGEIIMLVWQVFVGIVA